MEDDHMQRISLGRTAGVGLVAILFAFLVAPAVRAGDFVPEDGTIAYAWTGLHWTATHSKDVKQECPQGFNLGPREEFKALFPDDEPKRTVLDTQLRREIDGWYPTTAPEPFPFREAKGPLALGMNLDGKVGPNDFTSADGEEGIDNQLYRALGCIDAFRDAGDHDFFDNEAVGKEDYNRILIELAGVQSFENSPHVSVTVYRGLDPLLTDASNKDFLPGGTERIDTRWGRKFIQHLKGKIVNGVLTTEPHDLTFPWATFGLPTDDFMRAARFQLKLTPTRAEGLIGGYADVESWYLQTMKSVSTHHQSYGKTSPPSLYKTLRRLADAYPDPKTGANTAISSALHAQFVQVFVLHPKDRTLEAANAEAQIPYGGPPFPRSPAEELAEGSLKLAARGGR
jgi:hypothetical protein